MYFFLDDENNVNDGRSHLYPLKRNYSFIDSFFVKKNAKIDFLQSKSILYFAAWHQHYLFNINFR
ncbi:hypothetical protein ESA94_08810 [Lacibacter luteus]|uniref:Uncharacterized protein n=1 Tax=Lacibacter luteus TaxID=2508719 RepID=A0A4Q1CJK7_9BACT|nr:hypothetical protein [Lacibacter luteus]RXK60558.1 hypothetical protein ESA94_08810 [Lacibacter luteus]